MKLKAGYGYYDLKYYPIGGSFRRAGELGVEIDDTTMEKLFKSCHGCTATALRTDTKDKIAFNHYDLE